MNVEVFREYCLSLGGVYEDTPFGEETLVFKVGSKMFALIGLDTIPTRVNLKCDPERALRLREDYPSIIPGYHMNKKHWNSIFIEEISDELNYELINHSYNLVFKSLPKKTQTDIIDKH